MERQVYACLQKSHLTQHPSYHHTEASTHKYSTKPPGCVIAVPDPALHGLLMLVSLCQREER